MNIENLIKTEKRILMKLIGNMTRVKSNIDALRGTINTLAARAEKANKKTTKEYLATTPKINNVKVNIINRIAEETPNMKTLLTGSSSNIPNIPLEKSYPPPYKCPDYLDDYIISGQKRNIRAKKFQDDKTPSPATYRTVYL